MCSHKFLVRLTRTAGLITLLWAVFAPVSFARKFYFSSTGNDTYSITQAQNAATPWKTLQRLQTFSNNGAAAGDTFAFKCGETLIGLDRYGSLQWGLPFNNAPSGTATNPIVFTNYGTGEKPNFLFPTPSLIAGNSRIVFAVDKSQYIIFDGLQFNDTRFSVNDKVSTCFTKTGIIMGEEGAGSNNCIIKNCYFNNIGCGIEASGNNITILNNTFNNLKNWGDTATMADIGCVPMSLASGKRYLIKGNYIKGGWGFSGATASGQGLNGTGIEIVNDFDSSMIIGNTIIDCAGGIEIGNITGNSAIGCNNDTFAYNKIINSGVFCYSATTGLTVAQLHFYNNVYVENEYSRFTGTRFGTDVYGDGQSFSGFPSWPNFPKNPSVSNYGGFRIIQYPTETGVVTDSLIISRNNIFWMTNYNQAIYNNTRIKHKHANNLYHLVGQSTLGGTLNTGNFLESLSTAKIFTDTSNIHPENWNFQLYSGSPAINFGRSIGLSVDVTGMPIVSNPDAGIHEFTTSLTSPLVATATAGSILCNGGSATVTVAATGGLTPYVGIGNFIANAGTTNYQVTDALGNISNVSMTLTQPAAINATITTGRIIIFGGSTTATITASGGTGTYSYKLDNGAYQSANIFSGVIAGNHTISIKDINGCIFSKSLTLTQPSAPLTVTAMAATNPINCNGGSTVVTINATGGTAPYTGIGNFTATAGLNTYTIADSNGVTATTSITINQPTAITGTVTSGTITIFGGKTTVTITAVSGGTSPYTYAINGGAYQTNNIFSNIGAGQYQVFIKDAKNCVLTKSITITEPASSLAISATSTKILCNGSSSVVTVSASGGTAPYTGTGSFTALAGTYNYTVTDAAGTSKSTNIIITQPNPITPVINTGRIIVNGGSTNITVTASGGTGALTYKLNNSNYQANGNFPGVAAGTHIIFVKDSNNCVVSQNRVISQPNVFVATATQNTTINCNGGLGTVTVNATGGTPPYQGTGTFNVLAGTTTFNVTDSNGIITSSSITITQPSKVTATVTNTAITVYGAKSTINITGTTGGTAPYSYALNTGIYQSTTSFSNVSAGNHVVYIKDSKGCVVTYPLNITQPLSTLACTATYSTIACYGSPSTVTVSAIGGTPPYTGTGNFTANAGSYSYTVTDAVGSSKTTTVTISQPTPINAGIAAGNILAYGGTTTITVNATGGTGVKTFKLNNGTYQPSNIFTNIPAGADTIFVKDANNCEISQIVNITQPQPLVASITHTKIACFGGTSTITVTGSGGVAPYTGTGIFNVIAGTYTYTITDANGITARTSAITITQPTSLLGNANVGTVNNSVYPATSSITISGVSGGTPPYTYAIDNGIYQMASIFNNVPAGNHVAVIKDSNNCVLNKNVLIIQPLRLLIASKSNSCINQSNGSYTLTAVGGTRPYRFKISTSSSALGNTPYTSDSVFQNLSARVYFMRVKDTTNTSFTISDTLFSLSCARSGTFETMPLNENNDIAAYPNPSHENIRLELPKAIRSFDEMKIYDTKGRMVNHFNCHKISSSEMIISHLQSGMYFINIRKGNVVKSIKILIL